MTTSQQLHLTVLALIDVSPSRIPTLGSENINQGISGNLTPIVHTAPEYDPTAHERPHLETA
jgi:hypothetical protein